MPYVTPEEIQRAKKLDLLPYLQYCEPQELVHISGDEYTTRTHDSLKISNGKWTWWSRGIGGRSALDYLIKIRGMSLPEAVIRINGQAIIVPSAPSPKTVAVEPKKLLLPEKNENNNRVIAYLIGRGIHPKIIDYCILTKRLYESRNHHNAVFIGMDRKGIPMYGAIRGTTANRFMGDVNGSDKHYSFSISANAQSNKLHLFESAIDLLSYCTLEFLSNMEWRAEWYLSLAGIYTPRKVMEESKPPAALMQFLKDYPKINTIALHLDNDMPGKMVAMTINTIMPSEYIINNEPPKRGKDMNDYLKCFLKLYQPKAVERD
ncbi:MAG: DUF3991 and TOPRIM domain-containing protein [Eubacteriales bacterium]